MKINFKNNQGLSLVELLVAVSIFSILAVIIAGIYVAFSNSQARAQAGQRLLNDSQFALEAMAREIRDNAIFYISWPCVDIDVEEPGVSITDCLYLQKENGDIIGFAGDVNRNLLFYLTRTFDEDIGYYRWYTTGLVFIGPMDNIDIERLDFRISPDLDSDPFETDGPNQQPKVTIRLQTTLLGGQDIERVTYDLQTTVSSRVYKR